MIKKFSYKDGAEEIKNKIRDNYLEVAYRLVNTDEYKKAKKNFFKEIAEYAFIHILVVIMLFKHAAPQVSDDMFFFAVVAAISFFVVVPAVALYQNHKFTKKIKKYCLRAILQDLTEADYYEYKDLPDKPCIISEDDIRNLSITSTFANNCPFDIVIGNYNNTEYNLQEIVVHVPGKNGGEEFRGAALKTSVNTNINGWIEVASKQIADKLIPFKTAFIVMFVMFSFYLIVGFHEVINHSKYPLQIYCGILAVVALLSFIAAKTIISIMKMKFKGLTTPTTQSESSEINDKYVIRTSDDNVDLNKIVTPELCEVLEKVMKLYNTEKSLCRFNSNNILFLVSSYSNLFEIGSVWASPTNKRICEKFVSEIAGIMILIDYVTSNFCENN